MGSLIKKNLGYSAQDARYPTLTRQLRAVNHVNPVWAQDHRIPLLGLVTRT